MSRPPGQEADLSALRERLTRIREAFDDASRAAEDPATVEAVRVRFLGRRGELTEALRALAQIPAESKPAIGKEINALRTYIEDSVARAAESAGIAAMRLELARSAGDLTLPPRRPWVGSMHPVTRTRRELETIFREVGYRVEVGPEVEDDFHNFQALNLPPGHPARDATDTFYLVGGLLLRTHTSPVQIRTMERQAPPIRMVCPGRVYRRDMDATHLPMFHQIEALCVGEGISMADLKGTLAHVWQRFFGADVAMRLRPGYFPFVEPGCEYDISCQVCRGRGCRVCKNTGWIELGGAGMVHPAVFEAVGIDPQVHSGFAFGLGLDRIAMMRHGIDDLRLLVDGDIRFLDQFAV